MQHIVVTVAMICIVAVSGGRRCGNQQICGPAQCGPLERPVQGSPRRDRFCRPLFTPPWELWKLRRCVCKRRYLRNSWGECVPRLKCIPCKFKWQRDYRTCAPGCPATCNKSFRTSCNVPCTAGCVCPPGWVVHSRNPRRCVKAFKCLPRCPPNSSYQACVSTCLPKCGQEPPKKCHVNCERGACICKKGYLESERNGKKTCVLQAVCSWNTRTTRLLKPDATGYTATGAGSGTSRTLINEPESVLGLPEHAAHGSTIATVPTNFTSAHLQGTSSSDNAGHAMLTSSEGGESTLAGTARIGSAAVNTRVGNPIGDAGNINVETSRNTEVAVASGFSRFGDANVGAHSNGTLRRGPPRIVGNASESVHVGNSPNTGVAVTGTSSRVGEATTGIASPGTLHPGSASIAGTNAESDRGSINLSSSAASGAAVTRVSSGVGEATSRTRSFDAGRQGSASTAGRVVESAGGNILVGNTRTTGVAVTTDSSRIAEAIFGAPSINTLRPSPARTAGSVPESEKLNTHASGTNGVVSTGAGEGPPRSVYQPQGVVPRPEYASRTVVTDLMNGTTTGREDTRLFSSAGNTIVHISEGTHSATGAGRTGRAGGGIRFTHSTNPGINIRVNTPMNAGTAGGSGPSGASVATVRVPSHGAVHTGPAHVSRGVIETGTVSTHAYGRPGLPSPSAETNSNAGATLPGNAAGIITPGSAPPAAVLPSRTGLGSSTHGSGPHFSSGGTHLTDIGTIREGVLPGGATAQGGSAGTVVRLSAERPINTLTGSAINGPEATVSIVSRGSPSSATITGSPAIVSHITEEPNRYSLGVPGASINSGTATGFGSSVTESNSRNIRSPVAATPFTYGTTINGAAVSGNTPSSISPSAVGETSLGTSTTHMLDGRGRSTVLPSTTPSATAHLSHGTRTRSEGSPSTATENVLPSLNEESALVSLITAALGIHGESVAPRGVVPVHSNSNREQVSPVAVNGESSVSTVMTSAPGSTSATLIAGRLTGERVSAGGGATVTNTGTTPTSGTASPLSVLTESVGGTPTGATGIISGSMSGSTIPNGIPTVNSETVGLGNILGSISGPSSGTTAHLSAGPNTRGETYLYPATPSDSLPVGAETILRALTASGRNSE